MKTLVLLIALTLSSFSFAAQTCDLSANDRAVEEMGAIFDRGEMRGEDYVIALKLLYLERTELIERCVTLDQTQGITQQELIDTLDEMKYKLQVYLQKMDEAIRLNTENGQLNRATQLRFERDLHVAIKNLVMEKIKNLIQ